MSSHQSGLKALKRFEKTADEAVEAMPIARLPARALLAGLHYFIYATDNARLLGQPPLPGVAETTAARMGYTLPILERCPATGPLSSTREALDLFLTTDPDGSQLRQLLAYMHFSEIMPEAHKGYFGIAETVDGYRLELRDAGFADAQARDIILSELALVFPLDRAGSIDPAMQDVVWTLPAVNWEVLGGILRRKAKRLLFSLAEPNLITREGMERVFGFSYSAFYRIRAAILAYAEFALETSKILGAASNLDNGGTGISDEAFEWVSVSHDATWFTNLIAGLSVSDQADVERFMDLYSIDFRQVPARHHGGDGLFPPFARFDEHVVFSPLLVLNFLHLRNAVFAFSGRDEETYADHVSQDLEPVLVGQARELLQRSHPWNLKSEVHYEGGEIDLVVAGPSGPVLLIEAKGTLPPQGARLTERLSDRIREGVGQIRKFQTLSGNAQAEFASTAIGRQVAPSDLRFGLLARSCFGAPEVYDPALGIARITLPLLSLALGEMRDASEEADVDTLLLRLQAVELRYFTLSAPRWENGAIDLAGRRLSMPLLKFDERIIDLARRQSWEQSCIPPARG